MGLLVCSQNHENCQNRCTCMRYFDGTYLPGVKPLRRYSIKKKHVHVSVEYQKNALRALLRRFKACLGIKSLASYQTTKKRITVAPEDKKGASCTEPLEGRTSPKRCPQSQTNGIRILACISWTLPDETSTHTCPCSNQCESWGNLFSCSSSNSPWLPCRRCLRPH